MRRRLFATLRRNEIYVGVAVIGIVFVAAMAIVALLLRGSLSGSPYQALSSADLKKVFATGYLRFREDNGKPYLKVEVHNGTLWWIKKMEFDFEGIRYTLRDSDAFRPLQFGALRCPLKKAPGSRGQIEYDVTIVSACGYPPAVDLKRGACGRAAVAANRANSKD
jgi:hypothetical protein